MSASQTDDWPTDLKVHSGGGLLRIMFESGKIYEIPAELLRVESPSAEVKGHGPGEETLQWGKRDVKITQAQPIGNYAVRLIFSDGHSTGLFTWTYLAKLGSEGSEIFAAYEEKLKVAGLRR